MSYNEEKMKILNMVQEGKITAEDAIQLLEALEQNDSKESQQSSYTQKQTEFNEELNKMKDRLYGWKKEFKENFNQNDFDKAVDELTNKAEKIGKNVASATLGVTDRILDYVDSFVGTNVFNVFSNYNVTEKTYTANIAEGDTLDLQALNGNIVVKKHLENTVIVKARVRSSINDIDTLLTFSSIEGYTSLKPNNTANMSVSLEVYIPQIKLNTIKLGASNGKIYVEDAVGSRLEADTTNGQIEIMGTTVDSIGLKSRNGKINASYIIAGDISFDTANAPIDIKHVKAAKIDANTKNARVNIENIQNIDGVDEVLLDLKTTNAPIKVSFNDMEPRGYKVKGRTTNGNINILIPQLTYHNVNRAGTGGSFVEAESLNYAGMTEKVYIKAESTNASIEISQ